MARNQSSSCSIGVENRFGPVVASSCLNGFDFTLYFEESILTIAPLCVAILLLSLRPFTLWKGAAKVRTSWLLLSKQSAFLVYIVLQAALLGLVARDDVPTTDFTIPTVAATVAGYVWLSFISYQEHTKSLRPSSKLLLYLGVSCLLDLARVRTLFFVNEHGYHTIAAVNLAGHLVKFVLFVLELTEKQSLVLPNWFDASPEATSSIFNRAFYIWLNRLLLKGSRELLTVDALTPLSGDILQASKPTMLLQRWNKADKTNSTALLRTFLWHYKWDLLVISIPRLMASGFSFAEPVLIERVLDFQSEPDSVNRKNVAYSLIAAYALVEIGKATTFALSGNYRNRVSAKFRGSLVTLIFSKNLRLSASANADGEAITLMSSDIDRIDQSLQIFQSVFTSVVELGLGLFLLYRLLGVSLATPAVWIFLCLLAGVPIASAAGNAQRPWLEAIEKRLAVTTNVLGSMKAVKMTGLTDAMSSSIANLRRAEIRASRRHRILHVCDVGVYYIAANFMRLLGFGTFILLARANNTATLTVGVTFSALSLFVLLEPDLLSLITCFDDIQTLVTSFNRIQEYILSGEQMDPRIAPRPTADAETSQTVAVEKAPNNFCAVPSLSLENNKQAADAEKLPEFAFVVKDAEAGYSANKPVLVLKDVNLEIRRGRTTMVVGPIGSGKSTLLKLLLGEMPYTDGSVHHYFAKASFCSQSPWLIWGNIQRNILGMSSWDESWYNAVVRACSLSADFEDLPDGDKTETGARGSRLSGGQKQRISLARALYVRSPVLLLDDVITGLDRNTEKSIMDAVLGPNGMLKRSNSTAVLTTNSLNHLRYADHVIVLNKDGTISEQGTLEEVSSSGGYVQQQLSAQPVSPNAPKQQLAEAELPEEFLAEVGASVPEAINDKSRQTGDLKVYAYYARVAGPWRFLLYIVINAVAVFGTTFPSIWLQWWTNANAAHPNDRVGYWLGCYGAISVIAISGNLVSDWMLNLVLVPKTALRFHEILLKTTMRATTSFLTSTSTGSITNRFSQDLDLIDIGLPHALEPVIVDTFNIIVSAVLVCTGSGYMAATIPFCALFVYAIQYFYLRTSRQVRLLDIEAKAPLYSQFLETMDGIASIRAYGWTDEYEKRSYALLNASQKPFFLMKSIQNWLGFVLDMMVAAMAVLLVALATTIPGASTGFLGVALFSVIDFSTSLQNLVQEWTQLETAIGAVNRVRAYVETTEQEDLQEETDSLPKDWPKAGAVAFDGVSASYQASLGPVLKQISFSVSPGQKLAVCGRTGSGKSSLMATLLRMLELSDGSIVIDGVDISKVTRQEVRKRLNTLPQEPLFLDGTVRDNIDPLHLADNESMIEALRDVGLWGLFESRGGLDASMDQDLLSHGERQLFCLVRGIAKPGSIVIMDEATSSVDAGTDEVMQRVIRDKFSGRTIITVAHKLSTIMDYDCVALLDQGSLIEFGSPAELVADSTSSFHALYMSMGAQKI